MNRRTIRHALMLLLIVYSLSISIAANGAATDISGTVSLPTSMSAYTVDQSFQVSINTNWNGSYFANSEVCGHFTMSANERTATYQCNLDLSGDIGVSVYGGNMEGIVGWNYYNSNGTVWRSQNAERLVEASIHANIDIPLLQGITVSGMLQTPPNITFGEEKKIWLYWYFQYTNSSGYTYWSGRGYGFTLAAEAKYLDYELTIPAEAGPVKIGYRWQNTPEQDFVEQGYYLTPTNTVYEQNQAATMATDTSISDIDMTLLKGVPLNGTIYIPNNETNSQDMTVDLRITGDIYENQSITIPVGFNSADFSFSLPPGKQIKIYYSSVSNGDRGYLTPGYYTPTGTVTNYSQGAWISTSSPDQIDLPLLPGVTISGTVSLPDSLTYPETVEASVKIQAGDNSWWSWVSIPPNQNSVSWTKIIPTGQQDVIVSTILDRWSYDPGSDYLNNSYYHNSGSVGLPENAEPVDGSTDQTNIDITLLKGNIISGTISLESPDLFYDGYFSLTAYWGDDWADSVGYSLTVIADTPSFTYSIAIPPDAPDYRLRYYQRAAPAAYLSQGYFDSSQSGFCESDADIFTSGIDHPGTDLTLLKGDMVEGTLSLPNQDSATEVFPIYLGTLFNPVGEYATTTISYHTRVEIPAGSNEKLYELPLRHSCSETPEEFRIGYRQDNSDYVHYGFYHSNGTVGLMKDSMPLAAGESHTGIDIELIKGNEITGEISIPGDATIPENGIAIILGTLHEPDGLYHTTVIIEQGMTSAPYSIRVAPDVGDVALGYWLPGETAFAPFGFYSTLGILSSNVTGQYRDAKTFDSTTGLYENNNFTLDYGNEISGTVYTPDAADQYMPIEIILAEDPADPESIYWHTVMTIRPGTRATTYSRRVVLDSDIVVKFTNSDNPQWAAEGFFFDDTESVPAYASATRLTAEMDHSSIDLFLSAILAGDVNVDGAVDLTDAIICLQIMTGMTISEDISVAADVNNDGMLSMPEVISILNQL